MFEIFLFIAVFFGIIYGIFKLFYHLSNSLLLIDETFINYIKNIDDNILVSAQKSIINHANKELDKIKSQK